MKEKLDKSQSASLLKNLTDVETNVNYKGNFVEMNVMGKLIQKKEQDISLKSIYELIVKNQEEMVKNQEENNKRFDKIDTKINLVNQDVKKLNIEINTIKQDVVSLKNDVKNLDNKLNNVVELNNLKVSIK